MADNSISNKYVIVGDQAYSNEKILIYTLKVKTFIEEISSDDILKYFERFGQVLNVRYLETYNFSIQLAHPKDAAKALQQREHIISNSKIYVEPDICWHQPDIENFVKYIQEKHEIPFTDSEQTSDDNVLIETHNDDDNGALILKLNDFCLESICENLPIQDQINFALTCQRFCDIFAEFSRIKYTNLYINHRFRDINKFQIIIFGLIVGPYIQTIKYDYDSTLFAKDLVIYCIYLKTLRIYSVPITQYTLASYAEYMFMLKTLELIDVELTDRMINSITKFKNLKFLSLMNNRISGVTLSSLVNLKALSLNHCKFITSDDFKDICKNLNKLKYLDIIQCLNLGTHDFQCILENLIQLETLKFTITDSDYKCLARLPKLKNLELNGYANRVVSREFLQDLVKYQAHQMDNLKLNSITDIYIDNVTILTELKKLKVFWCCRNLKLDDKCLKQLSQLKELDDVNFLSSPYISDDGVLEILQSCFKLKKLHLVHCEQITTDLIRKAFKLLQNHHEKWLRTDCLHMTVEDENSFRNVTKELDLNKLNPVLKIYFESSKHGCIYHTPDFPEGLDTLEDNDSEGDVIDEVNDAVDDEVDNARL